MEIGTATHEAYEFLEKTPHPLTGGESVQEIIDLLKGVITQADATIHAYNLLPKNDQGTPLYKNAYETSVQQKMRAEDILQKLRSTKS